MGYKRDREYITPELWTFNSDHIRVRMFPRRAADQDRQHILVITKQELGALIDSLQRAYNYEPRYERFSSDPDCYACDTGSGPHRASCLRGE